MARWRRSCIPARRRFEFTAPNLQYLMDSPAEFGPVAMRQFAVDGRTFRVRRASHRHRRRARPLRHRRREDRPRARRDLRRVSRSTSRAPTRSSPTTCRTRTATAWSIATARSSPRRRRSAAIAAGCSTRSRTSSSTAGTSSAFGRASLEPFDFERANMSGELWLAEGFTQYYGPLALQPRRARRPGRPPAATFAGLVETVVARTRAATCARPKR